MEMNTSPLPPSKRKSLPDVGEKESSDDSLEGILQKVRDEQLNFGPDVKFQQFILALSKDFSETVIRRALLSAAKHHLTCRPTPCNKFWSLLATGDIEVEGPDTASRDPSPPIDEEESKTVISMKTIHHFHDQKDTVESASSEDDSELVSILLSRLPSILTRLYYHHNQNNTSHSDTHARQHRFTWNSQYPHGPKDVDSWWMFHGSTLLAYILSHFFLLLLYHQQLDESHPNRPFWVSWEKDISTLLLTKAQSVEYGRLYGYIVHRHDGMGMLKSFHAGTVAFLLDTMMESSIQYTSEITQSPLVIQHERMMETGNPHPCLINKDGLGILDVSPQSIRNIFLNHGIVNHWRAMGLYTYEVICEIANTLVSYTRYHLESPAIISVEARAIIDLIHMSTDINVDQYITKLDAYLSTSSEWTGKKRKWDEVSDTAVEPKKYMQPVIIQIQAHLLVPDLNSALAICYSLQGAKNVHSSVNEHCWWLILRHFQDQGALFEDDLETPDALALHRTFHLMAVNDRTLWIILEFLHNIIVNMIQFLKSHMEVLGGGTTIEEAQWVRYHQFQVLKTTLKFCLNRISHFSPSTPEKVLDIAKEVSCMSPHSSTVLNDSVLVEINDILSKVMRRPAEPAIFCKGISAVMNSNLVQDKLSPTDKDTMQLSSSEIPLQKSAGRITMNRIQALEVEIQPRPCGPNEYAVGDEAKVEGGEIVSYRECNDDEDELDKNLCGAQADDEIIECLSDTSDDETNQKSLEYSDDGDGDDTRTYEDDDIESMQVMEQEDVDQGESSYDDEIDAEEDADGIYSEDDEDAIGIIQVVDQEDFDQEESSHDDEIDVEEDADIIYSGDEIESDQDAHSIYSEEDGDAQVLEQDVVDQEEFYDDEIDAEEEVNNYEDAVGGMEVGLKRDLDDVDQEEAGCDDRSDSEDSYDIHSENDEHAIWVGEEITERQVDRVDQDSSYDDEIDAEEDADGIYSEDDADAQVLEQDDVDQEESYGSEINGEEEVNNYEDAIGGMDVGLKRDLDGVDHEKASYDDKMDAEHAENTHSENDELSIWVGQERLNGPENDADEVVVMQVLEQNDVDNDKLDELVSRDINHETKDDTICVHAHIPFGKNVTTRILGGCQNLDETDEINTETNQIDIFHDSKSCEIMQVEQRITTSDIASSNDSDDRVSNAAADIGGEGMEIGYHIIEGNDNINHKNGFSEHDYVLNEDKEHVQEADDNYSHDSQQKRQQETDSAETLRNVHRDLENELHESKSLAFNEVIHEGENSIGIHKACVFEDHDAHLDQTDSSPIEQEVVVHVHYTNNTAIGGSCRDDFLYEEAECQLPSRATGFLCSDTAVPSSTSLENLPHVRDAHYDDAVAEHNKTVAIDGNGQSTSSLRRSSRQRIPNSKYDVYGTPSVGNLTKIENLYTPQLPSSKMPRSSGLSDLTSNTAESDKLTVHRGASSLSPLPEVLSEGLEIKSTRVRIDSENICASSNRRRSRKESLHGEHRNRVLSGSSGRRTRYPDTSELKQPSSYTPHSDDNGINSEYTRPRTRSQGLAIRYDPITLLSAAGKKHLVKNILPDLNDHDQNQDKVPHISGRNSTADSSSYRRKTRSQTSA